MKLKYKINKTTVKPAMIQGMDVVKCHHLSFPELLLPLEMFGQPIFKTGKFGCCEQMFLDEKPL